MRSEICRTLIRKRLTRNRSPSWWKWPNKRKRINKQKRLMRRRKNSQSLSTSRATMTWSCVMGSSSSTNESLRGPKLHSYAISTTKISLESQRFGCWRAAGSTTSSWSSLPWIPARWRTLTTMLITSVSMKVKRCSVPLRNEPFRTTFSL